MQFHMRRLVEVTKDIDGFKVCKCDFGTNVFIDAEGLRCGARIKGKRVLQTDNY